MPEKRSFLPCAKPNVPVSDPVSSDGLTASQRTSAKSNLLKFLSLRLRPRSLLKSGKRRNPPPPLLSTLVALVQYLQLRPHQRSKQLPKWFEASSGPATIFLRRTRRTMPSSRYLRRGLKLFPPLPVLHAPHERRPKRWTLRLKFCHQRPIILVRHRERAPSASVNFDVRMELGR